MKKQEYIIKNKVIKKNNMKILEENQSLSKSIVWDLQAKFYENQGPDAWKKGIVPQYVTTNPYIANIYSKTVFGYIRDYVRTNPNSDTLYVLELAAGVGRFTFSFIKNLKERLASSPFSYIKVKYILTDFAKSNVDFWMQHPYLQPFFESGFLDCAIFDMTKDTNIQLLHSKEVLGIASKSDPLILIGNYAFDTLPQDTFLVKDGNLYEGRITITSGLEKEKERSSVLEEIQYFYDDVLLSNTEFYEEKEFNDILKFYKTNLSNGSFSFLVDSLRCMNRLRRIFTGDFLLICSDKGYNKLNQIEENPYPKLASHGSISLPVNFHSIELYFKLLGGTAIHSENFYDNITTSLFMASNQDTNFMETTYAFSEYSKGIDGDGFHTLKLPFIEGHKTYTSKQLLAYLRYTHWDSRTFIEFYNTFMERIQTEEDFPKEEFVQAIFNVWDNYFPIGEEGNLAYTFGSILAYFGYDYDAIQFFETSLLFYEEEASIYYEIALCYLNLELYENAFYEVEKSLQLDETFEESLNLKAMLLKTEE